MAYRLKRTETVAGGVRRVAREEATTAIASAAADGRPAAERVHEARTCCKKLRGLLRLVRPHLGETYGRENAFLRDAAGRLSAARDAAVLLETLDGLARSDRSVRAAVRAVRPALAKRGPSGDCGDADRLAAFAESMREFSARIDGWPLDASGFAALRGGLTETYRRGRKAMSRAMRTGEPDDWHEWRKRAKDHWYHVRLLRNVWKPEADARRGELDRLSDLLGEEHDLTVLRLAVREAGASDDVDGPLSAAIGRRRDELRAAAGPLGRRLYAEKAGPFARRFRRYWKVWRESAE